MPNFMYKIYQRQIISLKLLACVVDQIQEGLALNKHGDNLLVFLLLCCEVLFRRCYIILHFVCFIFCCLHVYFVFTYLFLQMNY